MNVVLLCSDIEHIPTDINALPHIPCLFKNLSRETWPTSYIQDKWPGVEGEQLDGSIGKEALDILDASVAFVLAGFYFVVVEVGG